MEYYTFFAEQEDENSRIDLFLTEELDDYSRNNIQKFICDNGVQVNSKVVSKNHRLKNGDFIEVNIKPSEPLNISAENIPLDILFEDSEIIVINKPQGMVVHPAPGNYTGTLVNALMYHCGESLSGINGVLRPGIVHRIDKNTSGVLVAAKTNTAHRILAEQLAGHTMLRIYNAVAYGNIKDDCGTVNQPIGRSPADRKKMAITSKNSKTAITHYKVLKRLGKYTLLEARLETGRTHQIRVHMSYIGHPLVGDTVYGQKKCPFNLMGQALHAKVLGFIHPATREYMEFETGLPEYFTKLMNGLTP